MRITRRTSQTLEIKGTPGGLAWTLAFVAFGIVVLVLSIVMGAGAMNAGAWTGAASCALGFLIGAALAYTGLDRLLTRRSIVFDLARAECVVETRRVLRAGAGSRVPFDRIEAIRLSRREEHHARDDGAVFAVVWQAEVLIDKPRDTILLAESQNDREAAVREVAEAVAQFLDRPLVESIDEEEETIEAGDVSTPLVSRGPGLGGLEIEPQPKGSRINLTIDPESQRVTLRWKASANGCVILPGIAFMLVWSGAAVAFTLASLGVFGQSAAQGSTPLLTFVTAMLAIVGLIVLAMLLYLLLVAHRVVTITPAELRSAAPLGVQSARLPLGEITSVRMSKGDDAILISAGKRRARIGLHLPADGELKWLAATIRASVRAMGG